MKPFFPETGSDADWSAAFDRLEVYLAALQLRNRPQRIQLALTIIRAAAARHESDPNRSPTTVTMEEARLFIERWFERRLDGDPRAGVTGRLALFITDTPAHWPRALLANDVPLECEAALRASGVRGGPDLQVSRMVPRPLDASPALEAIFTDGWERLERSTVVLALASLALILGVFVLAAIQ